MNIILFPKLSSREIISAILNSSFFKGNVKIFLLLALSLSETILKPLPSLFFSKLHEFSIVSFLSITTLIGFGPFTSLVVNCGLSNLTVFDPTKITSEIALNI